MFLRFIMSNGMSLLNKTGNENVMQISELFYSYITKKRESSNEEFYDALFHMQLVGHSVHFFVA